MLSRHASETLLRNVSRSPARGERLRRNAMGCLIGLPGYSWCGVYRLEGDVLRLDAYEGAATEHTEIPVGTGVCGTAVAQRKNQVVADVRGVENYLSCSASTRSEIVVLIEDGERILGQIDVDGHRVNEFGAADEEFLGKLARVFAERWD